MGEEKEALPFPNEEEDVYWARAGSDSAGIVVATVWMLCKPRQFEKHSLLYTSCHWDSLIGHSNVFNLWVPKWARVLAIRILNKLVQELKERPRPIVFATFSGGLKSCLYKIFQILHESCQERDSSLIKYKIVRDCYAGQIHDSSPVDFVSSLGAHYATHPIILGTKKRNGVITWSGQALAKALDFVFLPKFEEQRVDMWNSVDKAGEWGPVLILCSKDDDLAPFEDIQNFSSRLTSLGCKVTLVVWQDSPHVGHLKAYPDQYISAVSAFLSNAAVSSTLKLAPKSQLGFRSTDRDGSISGSATSSWIFGGQKVFPQHQNLSSSRLESETSTDGKSEFWMPSRL